MKTADLRGMSDEQFANTTVLPLLGENPVSAAQLSEMLVIGHILGHLESIQASIQATA